MLKSHRVNFTYLSTENGAESFHLACRTHRRSFPIKHPEELAFEESGKRGNKEKLFYPMFNEGVQAQLS